MSTTENKVVIKSKLKKTTIWIIAVIITLVLVSTILYLSKEYKKTFSVVPDVNSPVALVNGVAISQKSLDIAMSGLSLSDSLSRVDKTDEKVQELMRKQALNSIIDSELIVQKAKEQNITVTQLEIDDEILRLKTEVGGNDSYTVMMNRIGLSEEDMRKDIENQLLISKYDNNIFNKANNLVSETDVRIFYEALRDKYIEQGSIAPDLDIIRAKIVQQIIERKKELRLEAMALELRKSAKIEIYI